MAFDFTPFLRKGIPAPAARFTGFPKYNFIGGHNDPESIPVQALADATARVLAREGRTLATYGMESGPQGYLPLREMIAKSLSRRAQMPTDADQVLVTSGSGQALELANMAMIEPGDVVVLEAATYSGTMGRLKAYGGTWKGVTVDDDGMRTDELANVLKELQGQGKRVKYIYTIPTVQNPTGTVMSRERRLELLKVAEDFNVPVFEDDCYADLLWDGARPPAIRALDTSGRVFYCGSFSKSISPALRAGYMVADWPLLGQFLAVKTVSTGALSQMVLAEMGMQYFDSHVDTLVGNLKAKRDAIVSALRQHFGPVAHLHIPRGGIFIWVTMPDSVDTSRLAQVAAAEGIAINPGAEWVADPQTGVHSFRLCFGNPSVETIKEGVAKLATVCQKEFPQIALAAAPVPA